MMVCFESSDAVVSRSCLFLVKKFVDEHVRGKKGRLGANATRTHLAESGKHDALAGPIRQAAALSTPFTRDLSLTRSRYSCSTTKSPTGLHSSFRSFSVFTLFLRKRHTMTGFFTLGGTLAITFAASKNQR